MVGQVGSGKSSFLCSLLGELAVLDMNFLKFEKQCKFSLPLLCTKAYCSQSPWILNSSIKDNILCGFEFNSSRFQKVLDLCCLKQDLLQMEKGENTICIRFQKKINKILVHIYIYIYCHNIYIYMYVK